MWEQGNRSLVCSFWGSRTWKRLGAPPHPRASTCADICLKLSLLFLASCSTFYLLLCSRVSYRRRGSEVLSHAVQLKSSLFLWVLCMCVWVFFFLFFGTWQIINGGLAALRQLQRANACEIRCLTGHTDKKKKISFWVFFYKVALIVHLVWAFGFERGFCRSWEHLSNKIK